MKHQLDDLAARGIPDDFDMWPGIQARLTQRKRAAGAWRTGLAAVAVAVVLMGATVLVTSTPSPVSAEIILDRAGAVSDGAPASVRTYHIIATTTLRPADPERMGAPIVQRDETWFGGSDRIRQETQSPDWSAVIARNGAQAWWAVTRGGQTYYAPANGIRFSDTARLNPLAPEGTNIANVLMLLRQRGCGTPELRGEETVAGRAAYVLTITHTLKESCGDALQGMAAPSPKPASDPAAEATAVANVEAKKALARAEEARKTSPDKQPARPEPSPGGVVKPEPSPGGDVVVKPVDPIERQRLDQMMNTSVSDKFWIDKQTFVTLKAEQNIGLKGTSVYEVSSVAYDITLADSLFQYAPVAGAHLLSDPSAIKQTLAAGGPAK
jgi:hypothetical protein